MRGLVQKKKIGANFKYKMQEYFFEILASTYYQIIDHVIRTQKIEHNQILYINMRKIISQN